MPSGLAYVYTYIYVCGINLHFIWEPQTFLWPEYVMLAQELNENGIRYMK